MLPLKEGMFLNYKKRKASPTEKAIIGTIFLVGTGCVFLLMLFVYVVGEPTHLNYKVEFHAFYVCDPTIESSDGVTTYKAFTNLAPTDTLYVCADITNLTPEEKMNIAIQLFEEEGYINITHERQLIDMEQGTFVTHLDTRELTPGKYRIEARRGRVLLTESYFEIVPFSLEQ